MQPKKGPFILIVVLLLILVFIVGVRYGQRVEMTNKATFLALSLTPKAPRPTKGPLRFLTYTNKTCGFEFLYPSSVDIIKQSSDEARLSEGSRLAVAVSCAKNPSLQSFFQDKSVATQEVKFQKLTYQAKARKNNGQKFLFFSIRNPLSGLPVYIAVEEKLFPLVESSLIFK